MTTMNIHATNENGGKKTLLYNATIVVVMRMQEQLGMLDLAVSYNFESIPMMWILFWNFKLLLGHNLHRRFKYYLTQGQIALRRSTAQYLSSVRSDVVSEVRDQTAGRKLGISLSGTQANCWREAPRQ